MTSTADAEPWQKAGNTAPSFYAELFETPQRATIKFDQGAVWPCLPPTFVRLNLPFGHVGLATDDSVDDYMLVLLGKSPPPAQIKDAPGIDPVWSEFRYKMIILAKSKIPAQCAGCCCSCLTADCWMPPAVSGYATSLQALAEEFSPKFAAAGVKIEFFDKSGNYSYKFVSPLKSRYVPSQYMPVVGVTLEKTSTAIPAAPVKIERD